MDNYDLLQELQHKTQQLETSIRLLRQNGTAYAEAERNYKILLRQECLKLRDDGMAIGMIDKTCYGIPSVAEARFNRDVAETIYKANQEAINSIKLQYTGDNGVHFNRRLDLYLKAIAQVKFEQEHTREDFIKTFGKSYL